MTGRERSIKRTRVIRALADQRVGTVGQIAIWSRVATREVRQVLSDLEIRSLVVVGAEGRWILTPTGRQAALESAGERPRTPLGWGQSVGDPLCWACSGAYEREIVQVVEWTEPLRCDLCGDETISREVVPTDLLALDTVGVSR